MTHKTLKGLRILNTRPLRQAQAMSQRITALGGISIECPCIEIQATDDAWLELLPDLNKVDLALFISANAVECCFQKLKQKKIAWPQSIQVIAIGQASAKALKDIHIDVNAIPSLPDSEHLLELNELKNIKDQTVLLFKGIKGRTHLETGLVQGGAKLIKLDVYQRMLPKINEEFLESLWRDDGVDIILLTSEESIHNLFKLFNQKSHSWLQSKSCVVLSERLAKSASSWGMKNIIICHPEHMMDALLNYTEGLAHGKA